MDHRSQTWSLLQPTSSQTQTDKIIDVMIAATILITVISFMLESIPSLSNYKPIFSVIEVATLTVFMPKYLLRL